MGGEKFFCEIQQVHAVGSPPRGRGKDEGKTVSGWKIRITPAWAGKSFYAVVGDLHPLDHPRVGGEKSTGLRVSDVLEGSPPRGRGKDVKDKPALILRGITPAWAGKS